MPTLRESIQEVQKIGKEHGFTVIIVGGAFTRLIGRKTAIKKIDTDKHFIVLQNAENPSTRRQEDQKTTVDIDCIAFSNEPDPFTKDVYKAFYTLKRALRKLQQQPNFPAISVEPVLYHPYFPKPNVYTQFVSSIESYHDHDFFFRLGHVKQDVKRSSIAFWTYELSSTEQLVSFHPAALQMRYSVRGFSPKLKDMDKMWSPKSAFAQFVADFNKKTDNKYTKDLSEWQEFADNVQKAKQPSMKLKRTLWKTYWNTIGTYLAHGTGLVGKVLLPLGNTFFAGK